MLETQQISVQHITGFLHLDKNHDFVRFGSIYSYCYMLFQLKLHAVFTSQRVVTCKIYLDPMHFEHIQNSSPSHYSCTGVSARTKSKICSVEITFDFVAAAALSLIGAAETDAAALTTLGSTRPLLPGTSNFDAIPVAKIERISMDCIGSFRPLAQMAPYLIGGKKSQKKSQPPITYSEKCKYVRNT